METRWNKLSETNVGSYLQAARNAHSLVKVITSSHIDKVMCKE